MKFNFFLIIVLSFLSINCLKGSNKTPKMQKNMQEISPELLEMQKNIELLQQAKDAAVGLIPSAFKWSLDKLGVMDFVKKKISITFGEQIASIFDTQFLTLYRMGQLLYSLKDGNIRQKLLVIKDAGIDIVISAIFAGYALTGFWPSVMASVLGYIVKNPKETISFIKTIYTLFFGKVEKALDFDAIESAPMLDGLSEEDKVQVASNIKNQIPNIYESLSDKGKAKLSNNMQNIYKELNEDPIAKEMFDKSPALKDLFEKEVAPAVEENAIKYGADLEKKIDIDEIQKEIDLDENKFKKNNLDISSKKNIVDADAIDNFSDLDFDNDLGGDEEEDDDDFFDRFFKNFDSNYDNYESSSNSFSDKSYNNKQDNNYSSFDSSSTKNSNNKSNYKNNATEFNKYQNSYNQPNDFKLQITNKKNNLNNEAIKPKRVIKPKRDTIENKSLLNLQNKKQKNNSEEIEKSIYKEEKNIAEIIKKSEDIEVAQLKNESEDDSEDDFSTENIDKKNEENIKQEEAKEDFGFLKGYLLLITMMIYLLLIFKRKFINI